MTIAKKMEFQGKDVAEAIMKACEALNVSQEELDIEVLHTGSPGVFGLCKRPARLRVARKGATAPEKTAPVQPGGRPRKKPAKATPKAETPANGEKMPLREAMTAVPAVAVEKAVKPERPERPARGATAEKPARGAAKERVAREEKRPEAAPPPREKEERVPKPKEPETPLLSQEEGLAAVEQIRRDLGKILDLMGFPSELSVALENNAVVAHVKGGHVDNIVGPEGRTLDSLQYLLRKMLSRNYSEKVMLSLDAGDFRANRLQELVVLAQKLAAEVKENGRTSAIPSLNPSERRIVHMTLQADKDIRSRSVGDGLFKKVLIYKPGARPGKGGGRKRRGPPPEGGGKDGGEE